MRVQVGTKPVVCMVVQVANVQETAGSRRVRAVVAVRQAERINPVFVVAENLYGTVCGRNQNAVGRQQQLGRYGEV